MSGVDLDGSHTPALRGGEQVAYQGVKRKRKLPMHCILQTGRVFLWQCPTP